MFAKRRTSRRLVYSAELEFGPARDDLGIAAEINHRICPSTRDQSLCFDLELEPLSKNNAKDQDFLPIDDVTVSQNHS